MISITTWRVSLLLMVTSLGGNFVTPLHARSVGKRMTVPGKVFDRQVLSLPLMCPLDSPTRLLIGRPPESDAKTFNELSEPLIWIPRHLKDAQTGASADEVSPGLWIGNSEASRMAAERGFTALLNLTVTLPATYPPGLVYKKIRFSDVIDLPRELLEPLLEEVVRWTLDRIHEGHNVLVHCEEGGYRSPMGVIAILAILYPKSSVSELFGWVWGIRHFRIPPPIVVSVIQSLREREWVVRSPATGQIKLDPIRPRTQEWFDVREMLRAHTALKRVIEDAFAQSGKHKPDRLQIREKFPEKAIHVGDRPPEPEKTGHIYSLRDRLEKIVEAAYSSFEGKQDERTVIEIILESTNEDIVITLHRMGSWSERVKGSIGEALGIASIYKTEQMTVDFSADEAGARYAIRFPKYEQTPAARVVQHSFAERAA